MSDYANDEETLEALKNWWDTNGQVVTIGAALGLVLVLGTNFYTSSRSEMLESASAMYENQYGETATSPGSSAQLVSEYAGSPYAALASLTDAKQLLADGDFEQAEQKLLWVAENADQPAVRDQARLRLSRVMLSQQKNDQALQQLKQVNSDIYGASVEELRGDIAVANGDLETARNAYQGALTLVDRAIPQHKVIVQLKLDGLGQI